MASPTPPIHRDGLTAEDVALAGVACERAVLNSPDEGDSRLLAIALKLAVEAALRHTEEGP